ncbi:MAG: FGGY family carbohydrate kinase [Anaeromyxobacter sp.]
MATPLLLAIDQGTSSTKCLLVDGEGAVVARGSAPLGEQHPQPGWVDQDAKALLASVRAAVADCLRGQDPKAVAGIGISNQRESLVAWDGKTGEPVAPLISWQDQRSAAAVDALRTPELERLVQDRSGLPLDHMFSAAKARWLLDALDPSRARARAGAIRLGTVDSWLLWQLAGGEHVVEAGNASRTQLLDVRRAAWDDDLLELFDVPREALPRVVPSVGPFGHARGLAPLPDGVPILSVLGDSHSALFAHGGFRPGTVKATFGTGSSVMGLIPEPGRLAEGLCLTIGWSLGSPAFAAEGNIRSAGATLRWMAELLGVPTEQLAELAATASSEGVSVVPGFNGLGAPWWDRDAVGLITNCTLGTGRAQLARAALESIVHQVADVVEAVDRSVGRVAEVFADGGPTRNAALMQLQADVLGRPVVPSRTAELSALGVAHLAGLQAGIWTEASLAQLARDRTRYEAAWTEGERSSARARWHAAVRRARGLAVTARAAEPTR